MSADAAEELLSLATRATKLRGLGFAVEVDALLASYGTRYIIGLHPSKRKEFSDKLAEMEATP